MAKSSNKQKIDLKSDDHDRREQGKKQYSVTSSSSSSSSSSNSTSSSSDSSSSSSSRSRSSSTSSSSTSSSPDSRTPEKVKIRDSPKHRRSSSSSSRSSSSRSIPKRYDIRKSERKKLSRSLSPRRKGQSLSPRPKKVHVGRLTRNVTKEHLKEVFSLFCKVKHVDLPLDRTRGYIPRGFAYIELESSSDADKAIRHMNRGLVDGQEITVAPVLPFKQRAPHLRRASPGRRGPYPPWRRSPGFKRREWNSSRWRRRVPSPGRYRTPAKRRVRSRSRSPIRWRRNRRSSSSSS